jgi:hypothetical protein
MMHTQIGVNPLDVAFHLRHFFPPLTAIASVAAPLMSSCISHPLRTGFHPHSHAHVHLALRFLSDTGHGRPDHPLVSLRPYLYNFRGPDAADGHHHLSRTDVHREYQLAWRSAQFPVSQKAHQRFEDNLDKL